MKLGFSFFIIIILIKAYEDMFQSFLTMSIIKKIILNRKLCVILVASKNSCAVLSYTFANLRKTLYKNLNIF